MFTKTKLALALTLLAAATTAQADLILWSSRFEPLKPVSGKSGHNVRLKATLYGVYYNTETRRDEYHPLQGASLLFEAHRVITKNGTRLADPGPVGRLVETDVNGYGSTTYKLPSGAKKPLLDRYQVTFEGGMFGGVMLPRWYSPMGDVVINP